MDRPFLVGKRVYLRPLEPGDAERFAQWMNDGRVTRTLMARGPITVAAEREWIERVTRDEKSLVCAIVRRSDDRHIGSTGLHGIDWQSRSASFGISIGVPEMWGKGYGTETTRLITAHAFRTLNLNRVWLEVHADNPGARRAYEKAGYRLEGVQRQAVYREGHYSDLLLMAILREEWEALESGSPPHRRRAARPSTRRSRR
jgi:RimJ/RimL family protein N-acetyltransferase